MCLFMQTLESRITLGVFILYLSYMRSLRDKNIFNPFEKFLFALFFPSFDPTSVWVSSVETTQWITSLDIYMHEQGRAAVRTVSFTSSQQLLSRLLFMSGAPLGAFWVQPAKGMEFALAVLPLISHCFSGTWEQEVYSMQGCLQVGAFCTISFAPLKPLKRKAGNIFKIKTVPSEVNRRKAVSGFSSIKPQSN